MKGESSKKKRKLKKINLNHGINLSQEKASYFFFIGLLIIAVFGCVASGSPKQGFYGILFISIGGLVAFFPPVFIISKWLNIGLTFFLISLSTSLLPRSFACSQSWRTNLESVGLETGKLISPHPASTVESLIIVGSIILVCLCSFGHRISRDRFLKISTLFVIAVSSYTAISMLFYQNKWNWEWDPNNQFGFFANRNHMATLMVMGSLVGVGSLFIYLKKKNWKASLITIIATGIICWAILGYSISRSGMVLFISFQITWFVFVVKKNLNYKLITSFLVLFSLAIILFLLSDTDLEDRFESLLKGKESSSKLINNDEKSDYTHLFGIRKYIHADTYRMIQSEPWTGTGLGTFEFIFPFHQKESTAYSEGIANSKALHPDSHWLDLASQAGLLSPLILFTTILIILILTLFRNRKSRSWLLSLSCILSILCIVLHGLVDVPGQKVGIIISGILLIGITQKSNPHRDKASTKSVIFIYQLLAIGIFSLGLILVHSQWFSSKSIVFSDNKTRMNKIQNLYQISNNFIQEKDVINQKKYMMSAIKLTEKAIKRTPLDPDLHYIRGKLYSFLDSSEDKIKSSFQIESLLDPIWANLPLRQSQVWLFIDMKETRRLWAEALARSNKIGDIVSRNTWERILIQATQHPILIRDTYNIILSKNDSYYIKRWMDYASSENLNHQIPRIIKNQLLGSDTKSDVLYHWKKIAPKDYEKYLKINSLN